MRGLVRAWVLRAVMALGLVGLTVPAWAHFEPVTCRNSFTEDQEIAEGNKVALKVYGQMPVLPESDPVTRYVQRLGAKLVQFAPLAQGVNQQWPFNFHVVASRDINAFALPGGSIFVNLGTVQAAETEAQLAGVMAHEISHVVMRHSTCNLGRQQRKGLLYGIGAIGSAILLGNGAAGQLAQAGIGMGQNLDFLHMSRGDEQQADLLGVDILYDAGYDPRGLPQFFETIRAKYGTGGAQFLSDHPNPGNRTEYVNGEIATLPRRDRPVVTTAEFKQVHATAMTETALSAKEIQAGGWRQSGHYAARPGGEGLSQARLADGAVSGQAPGVPVLASEALGAGEPMVLLQASRFALQYPMSWKTSGDANGATTLAPVGGSGSFGLAYGALVAIEPEDQGGVASAAALRAATAALIAKLTSGNAGLAQAGTVTAIDVGGRQANAVDLRGMSPVAAEGGGAQAEHDWLITVMRPDGDLGYLVFVAPESQFARMRPIFGAMLQSFRAQ